MDNSNEKLTILDQYDCSVFEDCIRIVVDSPRDPSLSDIMSELYNSNGHMYFDNSYYHYNGRYDIVNYNLGWHLYLYIN